MSKNKKCDFGGKNPKAGCLLKSCQTCPGERRPMKEKAHVSIIKSDGESVDVTEAFEKFNECEKILDELQGRNRYRIYGGKS